MLKKLNHILCLIIPLFLSYNLPAFGQVTHGPLVGAVTSHSAKILLRTAAETEVGFELSTDNSFTASFMSATDSSKSEFDFFVTIQVTNLSAYTKYFYRPLLNGVPVQTINQFTTFPFEGSITEFTFAFGGCQQNPRDENSNIGRVFPLIAQDNPSFFLQLGDWTYPDTTDTPAHPTDYFNVDFNRVQANYRSKYDPNYPMGDLFKVVPIDYVYDDHDYSNNNSDMTFPGRENSIRGYREMFPHYPLANSENGLWHKFSYGNADFFVIDTRTQRDPNNAPFQQNGNGRFSFESTPEHLLLQADGSIPGELQMDWLIRELLASTADWKFICSSVPFNPAIRGFLELALLLQGGPLEDIVPQFGFSTLVDVARLVSDSWNGFPGSVARLVKAVNEGGVENVIVLSADTHTAAIDDGANSLFPEIMAGGLDRTNSQAVVFSELLGVSIWNRGGQTIARNNFNSHYGRVTVFGADSVRLELVDEFGEIITSYTQTGGHLVSKIALGHAIESRDFGDVNVGSDGSLTLLLVNTGADTVVIENITSSDSQISATRGSLQIPPGRREDVEISFEPQSVGEVLADLVVHSNDPESPLLIQVRGRGVGTTSVADFQQHPPAQFALAQNYPNPFNPSTKIRYSLPQSGFVTLTVYNIQGQLIETLVNRNRQAGSHEIEWHPTGLSSGFYFYRLQVQNAIRSEVELEELRVMILLK